jgi:hypothetical protein
MFVVSVSLKTTSLPVGESRLQILDTLTVDGFEGVGVTSIWVHSQPFSKKAPPGVCILPISNHRPAY